MTRANGGYHVYSFLVQAGTNVATITFAPNPSIGYGLLGNAGYYGPANTAQTTGQIIAIPNDFEWSHLTDPNGFDVPLTGSTGLLYSGTSGAWTAGLACAKSDGTVSDWWSTAVTFTAAGADPNGFTWTASASGTTGATTTTTLPAAVTTTTKPPKTTTTLHDPTTTTKPSGGISTTTTTIAGTGGTVPVSGAGGSVDPVTGFDSGTTGGTLPRTGSPVHRELGLGLFAIGAGLMLIGIDLRWKARGAYVS